MSDYGATDTTTTTLGANQFPVSAVFVPGDSKLTTLEGGAKGTDGNGKTSASASMLIKDGNDVTQGTSTDANTVNSIMGRLTKIRDLLNATLTVGGTITEANSASITTHLANIDSDSASLVTNTTGLATHTDAATLHTDLTTTNSDLSTINTTLGTLGTQTTLAAAKTDLDTIVTNTAGVATAANQTTGNTSLSSIATNTGHIPANGQATMSASIPVTLASDQTPLVTSTATRTNVAAAASDTALLASNSSRKGAIFYNDSTAILYLAYGSGAASTTSYSVQVAAQGYFELPPAPVYTGAIRGVWSAANGNVRITEFS